jgi:hypothetical protein
MYHVLCPAVEVCAHEAVALEGMEAGLLLLTCRLFLWPSHDELLPCNKALIISML